MVEDTAEGAPSTLSECNSTHLGATRGKNNEVVQLHSLPLLKTEIRVEAGK